MNHATDQGGGKRRAEIRAGELLRDMDKNKGAVPGKTGSKARPVLDTRPKLSDLGITKSQSSKWQRLAEMPRAEFEAKIERAKRKAVSAIDGTAKIERAELRERMRPAARQREEARRERRLPGFPEVGDYSTTPTGGGAPHQDDNPDR